MQGAGWKLVDGLTVGGLPYTVLELEPIAMPWIPPVYLDCVVYLFGSEEEAKNGEMQGGTGFIVGYPSKVNPQIYYHYAVTNRHVAKDGSPVIRMNTEDGRHDIIPLTSEQWLFKKGQDLAVARLDIPEEHFEYSFIPLESFLDVDMAVQNRVGPGDEVFMVGRFATHAGEKRNLPCARFGNISMMAHEPLLCTRYGHKQDSILVEVRTLSGFSGSPVFVYRTPATKYFQRFAPPEPGSVKRSMGYEPWLLGIVWSYLPWRFELKDKGDHDLKGELEGAYALGNSGMAAVIPAWRIAKLLETKPLSEEREEKDEVLKKKQKLAPVPASKKRQDITQKDFEEALKKASRKVKPKPSSESGQENA